MRVCRIQKHIVRVCSGLLLVAIALFHFVGLPFFCSSSFGLSAIIRLSPLRSLGSNYGGDSNINLSTNLLFANNYFSLATESTYRVVNDVITSSDVITAGDVDKSWTTNGVAVVNACARERTNLVYVKTHKTGSETMTSIFRRFGHLRNLSFVLPIGAADQLGWPQPFHWRFFRQRPLKLRSDDLGGSNVTNRYNILCEHSVFNERIVRAMMPPDTVYITSVRYPFERFISAFNYYPFAPMLNLTGSDCPVQRFIENLQTYDDPKAKTFQHNKVLLQNSLAYDLGFTVVKGRGSSFDETLKKQLEGLEKRFDLVLLMEFFDESLVLMKNLLCWSWKDLLYFKKNSASKAQHAARGCITNRTEVEEKYKNWSSADYVIYERFRRVFWQKVAQAGPYFSKEVQYFKKLRLEVESFCKERRAANISSVGGSGGINSRLFGTEEGRTERAFSFSKQECTLLNVHLLKQLKARQELEDS